MVSDADLLREFADHGSQDAFSEVVRRHMRLVYFAAVRHVQDDTSLAADVSQEVFAKLARNAARLGHHESVAAWLYATTRHAAIDARRKEWRRRVRERQAMIENQEPDWNQVRPILDEALDEMRGSDREAIVLRFFGGLGFAEVGRVLRLTEEAARKRVDRALTKLQRSLERKGVRSTSAALATGLAQEVAGALPRAVEGAMITGALAKAAAAATAGGMLSFTTITVSTGIAALVVSSAIYFHDGGETESNPTRSEGLHASLTDPLGRRWDLGVRGQRKDPELIPPRPRRTEPAVTFPDPAAAAPVARATWINAGQATPQATYQTSLWAMDSGNVDAFRRTLFLLEEDRAKVAALYDSQPEATRRQFGDAETLFASVVAGLGPIPDEFQVIAEKRPDPQTAVQDVILKDANGVVGINITYRWSPDGWQMVIPSQMVAGAIRRIRRP